MKWFKTFAATAALCVSLVSFAPSPAATAAETAKHNVNVYMFWGQGCPHCAKAKPFLEDLDNNSDNIKLYTYEVYYNARNQGLFQKVGERLDIDVSGVPLIVIGDTVFSGYSESYASNIRARAETCTEQACPDSVAAIVGIEAPDTPQTSPATPSTTDSGERSAATKTDTPKPDNEQDSKQINLPLIGQINAKDFSLPILTVIIAALDGFNPCAMWVLIFLISVLLGMHNRRRMLLLGSSFIAASAVVYFLFMTAWLNIFMFIGLVSWVKVLIGLVALGAGTYYLYDFCYNKRGACKVAGEGKRQEIFEKIRHITHERSFWLALVGIVSLAFAVNLIELVCSAGLPAIYTSVLAMADLPTWQYYAYLVLYVLIFMADDLFVFFIAMFTLQVTGLQSRYARFAHLIGGILMLVLGMLLIFAPEALMFG